MPKRNDAQLVSDIVPYKKIFPYIMPKRTESLVYVDITLDMSRAVQFVKEFNKNNNNGLDHPLRVFELFIAAMMRTIALRPQVNRFISRGKYWQRNELSCNFVVKEDYTDDAPEHGVILYFDPKMTLSTMANKINAAIAEVTQPEAETSTDAAINFFMNFPHAILSGIVRIIRWIDRWGKAPKVLRDIDGLHSSIFIANLGSVGLGPSPKHHLYEWGTTSLFVGMGTLRRRRNFDTPDESRDSSAGTRAATTSQNQKTGQTGMES